MQPAVIRFHVRGGGGTNRDFTTSPFVRVCAVCSLLLYADYPYLTGLSTGEYSGVIKYIYFAGLLTTLLVSLFRSRETDFGLNAPTIFLGFTVVSSLAFCIQYLLHGNEADSYATAFCATLVLSMVLAFDVRRYEMNFKRLADVLLIWLIVLAILHIGEYLGAATNTTAYKAPFSVAINHSKSIALVEALALAIVYKRKLLVMVSICGLAVVSELLRPESILLVGIITIIPLGFLSSAKLYRSAEYGCYSLLAVLALAPFVLQYSSDLRDFIVMFESHFKSDMMGGISNTSVRLLIADAAFEKLHGSSWIFGQFFGGATNVQVGQILPWWRAQNNPFGFAAIHSDYITMLLEGGVVGYLLFNLGLALIVRSNFAVLRRSSSCLTYSQRALVALGPLTAVLIGEYCAANPFLQLWQSANVVWLVAFCSMVSAKMIAKASTYSPSSSYPGKRKFWGAIRPPNRNIEGQRMRVGSGLQASK